MIATKFNLDVVPEQTEVVKFYVVRDEGDVKIFRHSNHAYEQAAYCCGLVLRGCVLHGGTSATGCSTMTASQPREQSSAIKSSAARIPAYSRMLHKQDSRVMSTPPGRDGNTANIFTDHAALLSQTDKALRISESRYRRLFEAAQDGILLLNAVTGQIEDVNPFLINMLGYSHEEFLGKKLWEIGAFKDTALNKDAFVELQTKRFIRYDDLPLVAKDGAQFSVEFVSNTYDCEGIEVIQCNIRDNTKRHLAEIALRATSRSLKMLSESNIALLEAETETILLAEYCRIAVETGGYRMAAYSGEDEHRFRSNVNTGFS